MAAAELTVATIVTGNDQSNQCIFNDILTAATVTDGDYFANGTDRRCFFAVKNASGGARTIRLPISRTYGTVDGEIGLRAAGGDWDSTFSVPPGYVHCASANGETTLYGPWNPYLFNASDGTITFQVGRDVAGTWTCDAAAVAGVTVGAFYLPWYDQITGAHSGSPDATVYADFEGTPTDLASAQTIIPSGITPSFTTHSSADGWIMPVRGDGTSTDGRRRFAWVRNATGGNIVLVTIPSRVGIPGKFLVSSGGDEYIYSTWDSFTISDGDEWLIGPFDPQYWAGSTTTYPDDLWIYSTIGIEANLDIAWLELPA